MSPLIANLFGFAGMACIIFAYGYITYAKAPNPFVQHGVNLLGAALLTVSLLVNLNPASLVLEFFWAAIAIGGLIKALADRSRKRETAEARARGEP
jgi:hypothetical protein